MRNRRAPLFGLCGIVVLAGSLVAAQAPAAKCSLAWVGRETELEEFLRTAPIAKIESVPIGVTKPRRAQFEPGGPAARAAWKVLAPSYRSGFHESYKAEIAAYLLDRVLDMHMVPPVVERKFERETGAMVLWIENVHPWDQKKPPTGPEPEWSRQISRMKMFDQLTANIDRNAGNILYDDDWHVFLIDHSRAFTDRKDYKGIAPLARVDRTLWNRIAALTQEQLQPALGQWLSPGEIKAVLVRRDRMKSDIDKMVAARGDGGVFF